jgi:hypothetical protein
MKSRKTLKRIPFFPVIPLLPAALLIGSLATAISALRRVRGLEREFGASKIS